jgi:hypothetical protein
MLHSPLQSAPHCAAVHAACVMSRIMHSPSPRATQSAVLALQSAHGMLHPALMQTHSIEQNPQVLQSAPPPD